MKGLPTPPCPGIQRWEHMTSTTLIIPLQIMRLSKNDTLSEFVEPVHIRDGSIMGLFPLQAFKCGAQ